MWFAWSALALLAVTLWMVVADYAQPWKRFQAEFRDLERKKLLADMQAERDRINQTELVLELLDPVAMRREALLGRLDLIAQSDQLGLIDLVALRLHLVQQLLPLEAAELRLIALPRLRVVGDDHPQGDRQERQRAQGEHHVHPTEVVMPVRSLFGRCDRWSQLDLLTSDAPRY